MRIRWLVILLGLALSLDGFTFGREGGGGGGGRGGSGQGSGGGSGGGSSFGGGSSGGSFSDKGKGKSSEEAIEKETEKEQEQNKGQTENLEQNRNLNQNGKGKGGGAETGKGSKDSPVGRDKGKKKGWEGEYPPGWDMKSDGEKAKWTAEVEEAKETVEKAAEAQGVKAEEKNRLRETVELLCRKGKDVKESTGAVVDQIKKGKNATEILKKNGIAIETDK